MKSRKEWGDYKPKEQVTYKMKQEYAEEKIVSKYILLISAEVKRVKLVDV
ncbi:MAG: hypothetical protein ACLT3E_04905 [Anaerovoracaceae bacterium]